MLLIALVLLVAGLIVLLHLRDRVRMLEARMARLEAGGVPPLATALPRTLVATPDALTVTPDTPVATPQLLTAVPEPLAVAPDLLAAAPGSRAEAPAGHAAAGATARDWRVWLAALETRLGGTWLSRTGALVLLVGVGFFLKYAADHGRLGPMARVLLGLAAGAALLATGDRLLRRPRGAPAARIPAQALLGAGLALLDLSVWAAHSLHALVATSTALGAVTLVTALGLLVALRHDASAIATLAVLGGLLAPVLLGPREGVPALLAAYVLLLDLGVLGGAAWRRWHAPVWVAFVGTHLHYALGIAEAARRSDRVLGLGACLVFLVLFALLAVVLARAGGVAMRAVDWRGPAALALAVPVPFVLEARHLLRGTHDLALGALAVGGATAYALVAAGLRRDGPAQRPFVWIHAAIALGLLTAAPALAGYTAALPLLWSVEALVLLAGGQRLGLAPLRAGSLLLLALAAGRWVEALARPAAHAGIVGLDHPALVATLALTLGCGAAATLLHRAAGEPGRWERLARPIVQVATASVPALFLTAELGAHRALAAPERTLVMLALFGWALAAGALVVWARGDRTGLVLGVTVPLLAVVSLVAVAAGPAWRDVGPAGLTPRFGVTLALTAVWAMLARVAPGLPLGPRPRIWLGLAAGLAAALLGLFGTLSVEVLLMPLPAWSAAEAPMLRQVTLSVLWTLVGLGALGLGLWHDRAPLRLGALGLFGLTVAKAFVVDLAALGPGYRILSFLVLGGVLLLASVLLTRRQRGTRGERDGAPQGS